MYKNNICVFTLSKCEAGIAITRKDRDGYFYVLFTTVSTLLFRNLIFHRSAFLIILIWRSLPHRNKLATHKLSGWKIFGVGSVAFLVGICCQQNYIWPWSLNAAANEESAVCLWKHLSWSAAQRAVRYADLFNSEHRAVGFFSPHLVLACYCDGLPLSF